MSLGQRTLMLHTSSRPVVGPRLKVGHRTQPQRPAFVLQGLAIAVAAFFTGCLQHIPISTNPTGASVLVDGDAVGSSPITVELDTHRDHIVNVKKEGYRSARVDIRSVSQTSSHTSMVNGLMSTSYSSTYWLEPKEIHVRLEPTDVIPMSRPPARTGRFDSELCVAGWQSSRVISETEAQVLRGVLAARKGLNPSAAPEQNLSYYVMTRSGIQGPLSYAALLGMLIEGSITPMTRVRISEAATPIFLYQQLEQQAGR